MIIYVYNTAAAFDRAVSELSAIDIRPRIVDLGDDHALAFRAKPCRKAKEILNRCGFVPYCEPVVPPTPEQLEALFNKLGPQS